jgi:hypothetical protein
MIEMAGHVAFELKDYFHEDPIREIYSRRSRGSKQIVAYREYLRSLSIIWQKDQGRA